MQPAIWAVTGKWQIAGPIARRDDDRRNIVLKVMDRLREEDFRRLRMYQESARLRGAGSNFRSWIVTVTARCAIDYVRAHPEYVDQRANSDGVRWVRIVAGSDQRQPQGGPSPQDVAIASELLDRAHRELDPGQAAVLCLWLQGEDNGSIARRLELGAPAEARRLLRSGLKRLRDRYAGQGADADTAIDEEKSP